MGRITDHDRLIVGGVIPASIDVAPTAPVKTWSFQIDAQFVRDRVLIRQDKFLSSFKFSNVVVNRIDFFGKIGVRFA